MEPVVQKNKTKEEIISFVKTLAVFMVIAYCLRSTVVQAFKIPSGSMEPTLLIGDHILVSKFSYGLRLPLVNSNVIDFAQPQRQDIVVFTQPDDPLTNEKDESIDYIIKRVIGLPGDKVEVRDRTVYINDLALDEPYARWAEGGNEHGNFGPATVPEGKILLLGDNRDHSRDSRYWSYPFLDLRRVVGRALIVHWTWPPKISRIGTVIR